MKKEEVEDILKSKYHHNNEDIDAEEIYYDNNRTLIRKAIEEGRIDPEVLTSDILASFISDGIDFSIYTEKEKEYCRQNNIDYNEYKKDREKIIEENAKRISEKNKKDQERYSKAKQIEKMLILESGYEFVEELREKYPYTEEYYDYLIDVYGEQFLSTPEIDDEDYTVDDDEDYIVDDDELQYFFGNAVNKTILPENRTIKNNWMNRIKEWIKDRVNNIKNTFQR